MTARKVFSLIAMIIIIYLIINMFVVPYVDNIQNQSWGMWRQYDESDQLIIPIFTLIALVVSFLATLLQLCGLLKDSKLAYFGIGFCLAVNLLYLVIYEDLYSALAPDASIMPGPWLGLIFSSLAFAILLVGNLLSNEKKKKTYAYYPTKGKKENDAPIVGYDPKTGEPVFAKPKGYNPRTGEPIYE